jgi:hypothetical protein
MQPHEEEVLDELIQLREKIGKLRASIHAATFLELSSDERVRRRMQHRTMETYEAILQERIDHFPKADSAGS